MNEESQNRNATPSNAPPPPPAEPSERGSILTGLLKAPHSVGDALAGARDLSGAGLSLLLAGIAFHAVYGFAFGLFGGLSVGAMAAAKSALVALFALLLCMPSLYVFSCVGGAPLTLGQTVALGSSVLAMIGLLLIGLAPVAWLFSASTDSLPFVVALNFVLWFIAVMFAVRYIGKLRQNPLFRRTGGIRFWFVVFMLVSLQMTTCLRPMLTRPEGSWWTGEKKFFLAHFGSCFETKRSR